MRLFQSTAPGECHVSCFISIIGERITYNIFNKWILKIFIKTVIHCNFAHCQCYIFWITYFPWWIGIFNPIMDIISLAVTDSIRINYFLHTSNIFANFYYILFFCYVIRYSGTVHLTLLVKENYLLVVKWFLYQSFVG